MAGRHLLSRLGTEMKYTQFLDYIDENSAADVALLKEYVALGNQIGMPAEKFDSALRWVKANGSKFNGDIQRAKASFREHMAQDGVDNAHVKAIVDWHGIVVQHGLLTDLPDADAKPDTSKDAALAAEIRQYRKDYPDDFWADKSLQDELQALNERLSSLPAIEAKPAVAAAPVAVPANRLAEIRQLRRNDPLGYDSDRKMQAEELALITATLPAPEASPALSSGANADAVD